MFSGTPKLHPLVFSVAKVNPENLIRKNSFEVKLRSKSGILELLGVRLQGRLHTMQTLQHISFGQDNAVTLCHMVHRSSSYSIPSLGEILPWFLTPDLYGIWSKGAPTDSGEKSICEVADVSGSSFTVNALMCACFKIRTEFPRRTIVRMG